MTSSTTLAVEAAEVIYAAKELFLGDFSLLQVGRKRGPQPCVRTQNASSAALTQPLPCSRGAVLVGRKRSAQVVGRAVSTLTRGGGERPARDIGIELRQSSLT